MLGIDPVANPIDSVAHVIQTALTPVFLLTGVASLLNVFASRLARVADRSHHLAAAMAAATEEERTRLAAEARFLQRRSRMLDAAVLLGTAAGTSTCLAALLLFVGSLSDRPTNLLYLSFGFALVCTAGALAAFMGEVLMASRGMRVGQEAVAQRGEAPSGGPGGT